jgi:large subunit ribosomal protein L31
MKKDIHPTYYSDALVTCACGNSWRTGSTLKEIKTDVCFKCHPFYTGESRIVDAEGQVDRFYKRLQARQEHLEAQRTSITARTSPNRPIADLNLGKRAADALLAAGVQTTGQFIEKLALGEQALLDISGFGRKSLLDARKALRQMGYDLPAAEPVA